MKKSLCTCGVNILTIPFSRVCVVGDVFSYECLMMQLSVSGIVDYVNIYVKLKYITGYIDGSTIILGNSEGYGLDLYFVEAGLSHCTSTQ